MKSTESPSPHDNGANSYRTLAFRMVLRRQ